MIKTELSHILSMYINDDDKITFLRYMSNRIKDDLRWIDKVLLDIEHRKDS